MKRTLSFILVASLLLGLLAGISFSAFAVGNEPIGITAPIPTVGGDVTTEGITGVPEGFQLSGAMWYSYNYEEGGFQSVEDATFADNKVYMLQVNMEAQGDNYIPWAEEGELDPVHDATINGELVDDWGYNSNEFGYTTVVLCKVFVLGNIQIIDPITVEALPAVEAGASTAASAVNLPAGVDYTAEDVQWFDADWNEYTEATLADGAQYTLCLTLAPKAGYWFQRNARMDLPVEASNTYFNVYGGVYQLDFDYDLRPVVKKVEISNIPEPVYGADAAVQGITVPNDANYTVSGQWQTWSYYEGRYVPVTGKLGYGEHQLQLTVTPEEGYTFTGDCQVLLNGVELGMTPEWSWTREDTQIDLTKRVNLQPENGYVRPVEITGAPAEITAGAAISAPRLEMAVDNVTLNKVQWVDESYAPVTGKFESGKIYYLAITVTPEAGYGLESGYSLLLYNGENAQWLELELQDDGSAISYARYSLLPVVDSVEITVTEPAVGAAPAEPKVPSGAKYTIFDYYWYDENGEEVTKFENNKVYYLDVSVEPVEGYELDEEAELTINGKEIFQGGSGYSDAYLCQRFSFKNVIDKVELTMPEPAKGGTGKIEDIKVPAGAKYSLNTEWSGWSGNTTEWTGTFGQDKYQLCLLINPEEGYEFAEDVQIFINGEELDEVYNYDSRDEIEAYYYVSFREKITKIEIPELPEVKVGDTAQEIQLTDSEDDHYQLVASWMKYQSNGNTDVFSGVFENGSIYYLVFNAWADEGYEFAEDAVILSGGKALEGGIQIVQEELVAVAKLYSFGLEVIDKIELTVDAPENGKAPGKITVPEDAPYAVENLSWGVSKTDDPRDVVTMMRKETFEYGKYYWLQSTIKLKEGYVLSDDLVITVNGQQMNGDPTLIEFGVSMGDTAFMVHNFGKLEEVKEDPIVPSNPSNPGTGDNVPVVALIVLMVLAAAGVTVLLVSKKRLFR